jgi:hypothetical protein
MDTTEQARDDLGRFASDFRELDSAAQDRIIDAANAPQDHPLEGFKEMPSAPEPEQKTFGSDLEGLKSVTTADSRAIRSSR